MLELTLSYDQTSRELKLTSDDYAGTTIDNVSARITVTGLPANYLARLEFRVPARDVTGRIVYPYLMLDNGSCILTDGILQASKRDWKLPLQLVLLKDKETIASKNTLILKVSPSIDSFGNIIDTYRPTILSAYVAFTLDEDGTLEFTTLEGKAESVNVLDILKNGIIEWINAAVEVERAARMSADQSLDNKITQEATARTAADNNLNAKIEQESTNRANADSTLNGKIEQETADRISADQNLNTKIGQEIADRQSAMENLNTSIEALLGAVIPRGIINVDVPTITQLNQYMQTTYQRAPLRGDMVRDLRNMEWYFDGTSWDEIGQSHIASASETVQGIAYLTNQEGTREDKAASQALLNKVKGDLQDEIANVEGMSPEDKAKLDSLPTNPVRSVNSKLPDINGNVVIDVGDGTGGGTGEAVQEIFFGICSASASSTVKVVTIPELTELKANMLFAIKFTAGNNIASPSININGSGLYGMRYQNIANYSALNISANETVLFLFDGTFYQRLTPNPKYPGSGIPALRVLATDSNAMTGATSITPTELNSLAGSNININQSIIDLQQQINEIDTGGGGGEGGPAEQSILHVMTWAQATTKALSITDGLFTAYIDHLDAGSPFGEDGLNGSIEVTFYCKVDSIYAVATLHGKGGQASRLYAGGVWGEWKVLRLTTSDYLILPNEFPWKFIEPNTFYQNTSENVIFAQFLDMYNNAMITAGAQPTSEVIPDPIPEEGVRALTNTGTGPALIIPPGWWFFAERMFVHDVVIVVHIQELKLGGI